MNNLSKIVKSELASAQPDISNMFISYFETGWFDGLFPLISISEKVIKR